MRDFLSDLPFIGGMMPPRPKVAVIRLSGIIADASMRKGGMSYARYARMIEKAFAVHHLREVALVVNSPGGAPAQSALLAGLIRQCADDKHMPVTAFVEDVAASGGYWLACAADKIYAQGTSIVGSVGVVSASFGFDQFIKKHEVSRRVHTSGSQKSMLDPFLPEKKADVERLTALQADIHAQFIAWVKQRRSGRLKAADADLFEGQVWTGAQAVAPGIIDALGDVRGVMHEKYGEKVRLMPFGVERKPLVQSLLGLKGGDIVSDALDAVDSRTEWQRYGL